MKVSFKGIAFYLALAGVAVCATLAFGPKAGMGAFSLLAMIIAVFG